MYPIGSGILQVGIKNTLCSDAGSYSVFDTGYNSLCPIGTFTSIYYIYVVFLTVIELLKRSL